MKVLITGGAGFLGSHLVDALMARNDRVIVLDNLSTGSLKNLAAHCQSERFQFVQGDIRDELVVKRVVEHADVVLHFAAGVGVRNIIEKPVQTLAVNCEGTRQVFSACSKLNKKVIFASTSEVYGKSAKPSLAETDDIVLGPTSIGRWGYACSKALDEFLAFSFAKELGLRFVIIRYFNVVGQRQSEKMGMVLPTFVKQAVSRQPLTIFFDGEQTRCFLHVSDAVDATLKLADLSKAEGQIFNIGNPESISINQLARKTLEITGSDSEILHLNPAEVYDSDFADMQSRVPDISKANEWIKFSPQRNIDVAIREVASEFK